MIVFQRIQTIGLSLVCAILCATLYAEIDGLRQGQPMKSVNRISDPLRTGVEINAEPANRRETWLNQIMARPLFSPNRRAAETPAHGSAGLPRLTGILIAGSRHVAIFADSSGDHATIVQAGSRIGNYDVRDIADSGVSVFGPEGATMLHPTFSPAPPPPAAITITPKEALPPRRPFLIPVPQ